MMSQVRNFSTIVLSAVLLLAAGCKDKNSEPEDPFVTSGNVENPNWQVTVDNDMNSSMTAIVQVPFAKSQGTLAAFMDTACCGIAEYQTEYGLYWLYISLDSETGGDIQLRFYSPELKRIFDAKETIPFRNDDKLGSVSNPYTPEWIVAK